MIRTGDALARALWRSRGGRAGLLVLSAVLAGAVIGPFLLPDPFAQPDILNAALQPPSAAHPMGTDQLSRDILSRVAGGARISLLIALLAVALSASLGALVGLVAGYWRGGVERFLMRGVDGALALPRLFVLLLLAAAWERVPIPALIAVLGLTGWFGTSLLVRAEVLRLREEDYVRAAEALGASRWRVIFRHLLPNALGPLLVAATLGVGDVILLEAGLSFLGLGVQPPTPSWGSMIHDSREILVAAPWAGIFPGLAVVITVLAFNLIGEALRQTYDRRLPA